MAKKLIIVLKRFPNVTNVITIINNIVIKVYDYCSLLSNKILLPSLLSLSMCAFILMSNAKKIEYLICLLHLNMLYFGVYAYQNAFLTILINGKTFIDFYL